MIFYFSGTGNSEWVAKKVACKIGDSAVDICRLSGVPAIDDGERTGFVFPVHAWGIPEPVKEFAAKLKRNDAFAFGICTCGEDAGLTMKKFSRIYRLDSAYSLSMPNNYIIGSDLEPEAEVRTKLSNAAREIDRICSEIVAGEKVYRVNEGRLARLKSGIVNEGFNKFARSAKPFYSDGDKCNGCGLCAAECPSSSITMIGGRPVWSDKCYLCLRCINSCPQGAIQYGKKTVGRRRYTIDKYLD